MSWNWQTCYSYSCVYTYLFSKWPHSCHISICLKFRSTPDSSGGTSSSKMGLSSLFETSHWSFTQKFWREWIGRGGPIAQSPWSPDLTPLYFFLWEFVKDRMYSTRADDLQVLHHRITDIVRSVTQYLERVWMCVVPLDGDMLRFSGGEINY